MNLRKQMIGIALAGLLSTGLLVAALCVNSRPANDELFRPGIPTVDDVKDAVKDDEYEKIEEKTNLVKEYIRVLLDNLF